MQVGGYRGCGRNCINLVFFLISFSWQGIVASEN